MRGKIVRIIWACEWSESILHYIFTNGRELCPEQMCELSGACELVRVKLSGLYCILHCLHRGMCTLLRFILHCFYRGMCTWLRFILHCFYRGMCTCSTVSFTLFLQGDVYLYYGLFYTVFTGGCVLVLRFILHCFYRGMCTLLRFILHCFYRGMCTCTTVYFTLFYRGMCTCITVYFTLFLQGDVYLYYGLFYTVFTGGCVLVLRFIQLLPEPQALRQVTWRPATRRCQCDIRWWPQLQLWPVCRVHWWEHQQPNTLCTMWSYSQQSLQW